MLRKLLLPALAIATLAGCATGYSYRGGNGDYYYGQPRVDYRYYGGYGFGSGYGYGGLGVYGQGYYLDVFGRPLYGYPYRYYGGRYPGYPHGHGPRPRPPHGPGHGGDHGADDGPPQHGDQRPGGKPPWRDIGRLRDHDDERGRPRRSGPREASPQTQRPPPALRPVVRPSAPVRERRESRPVGATRGGGSGERARMRAARPLAGD